LADAQLTDGEGRQFGARKWALCETGWTRRLTTLRQTKKTKTEHRNDEKKKV